MKPCVLALASLLACSPAQGGDWPMWRFDAGRTASAPDALPDQLSPQWILQLTAREPTWEDPLNRDPMPFDSVFEPILMQGRMYLGFNDRDKLVAYDLSTGAEVWTFYAGGPVRLPPAGWLGNIYFCSDDGFLYCVDGEKGTLRWKFQGAPDLRKAVGNGRIISAWPARGGPVIKDGVVYFAASIWPFMGTFLYALDAKTGDLRWVNDSTGSQYIQQPHGASSFAGVGPQGALVATADWLLVPGGRSVPAAFDRLTGRQRYFHLDEGGKGTGGSFVAADSARFYVHTRGRGVRAFDLRRGTKTAFQVTEPVLSPDRVYTAQSDQEAGGRQVVRAYGRHNERRWQIDVDGSGDLIQAGNRLYAAGGGLRTTIELPQPAGRPRVAWSQPIQGQFRVGRLRPALGRRVMAGGCTPQLLAQWHCGGGRQSLLP